MISLPEGARPTISANYMNSPEIGHVGTNVTAASLAARLPVHHTRVASSRTSAASNNSGSSTLTLTPSSSNRSLSPRQRPHSRPSRAERTTGSGGRKRGDRLSNTKRETTGRMRKLGACWRCAFQRGKSPSYLAQRFGLANSFETRYDQNYNQKIQ